MKFFCLIWAGLWRKPMRTVLTLLSIVVAFMLYGTLHGVTSSFDDVIDTMGDTRLRVQSRVNIIESMPLAYLPRIESVPGVEGVGYYQALVAYYQDPRNQIQVGAVGLDGFLDVYPEIVVPDEQREAMSRTRTGAIVGKDLAAARGWNVGDRVTLRSQIFTHADGSDVWDFDVVGIYELSGAFADFAAQEMYVHFDYFDEARVQAPGMVLLYFVAIDDVDQSAEIAEAIDALFLNSSFETQTLNEKDWVRNQIARIGDIDFFVNAIIGAVFFTLLFLTGNTMWQSVRERVPELAVLKTYGFGNATIVGLVAAESLLLCLTAAGIGLVIAATVFPAIYRSMGIGSIPLPPSVIALGIGIGVLVAVVSALPPAWLAQRLNVVDALAGR